MNRLSHAWNVFRNKDPIENLGPSYASRPDRTRIFFLGAEKTIISSIFTRLSIDVASVAIRHVRLDQNGRFIETINSGLNNCLSLDANVDQTGKALIQDMAFSMFDEGSIAVVPVETTMNPAISSSYEITSIRVGKIVEWYPYHVRINLYNEKRGMKEDIILPKKDVAVIENPLYSVMNEPNSTLKRLVLKLSLLDVIDQQSGSGKLDLIFQLPYVVKTATKKAEADLRRQSIEDQLSGSKHGIAYIDAAEKVTQLNRPVENNLMVQIQYLTSMLYSQLGLTEAVFNGTAEEKEMINYYNRSIEPVLSAITDSMTRRFITKTARTQGQAIKYFRDPFSLVPVSDLATVSDSFTRNAILSSNEIRSIIGYKPSEDPAAEELRNKNLNPPTGNPDQDPSKSVQKDAEIVKKESK